MLAQVELQGRVNVPLQAVRVTQNAVFLNIPYDVGFKTLYIAYIVGLVHLGFTPRVTLGVTGGERRLDKILELIQSCRYSIHDLSRVELDQIPPRTPHFNMPFELGLTVAWMKLNPTKHTLFVFEKVPHRAQKSISDLNGTDPHIHDGRAEGVMRELRNAFVRTSHQPSVPEMMSTYRIVSRKLEKIKAEAGAESLFEASALQSICYAARVATSKK